MSSRSASASAWRALWLPVSATLAIQTVGALAIYCAPVMAPVAGPALGVPASWIGYYIALLYMGSMFSSVIAGTWVARFGAVRVSQIGLLFNAAKCHRRLGITIQIPALTGGLNQHCK